MPKPPTTLLSGWGRSPVVEGREILGEDLELITADVPLTRGLARSYGDASLPPPSDPRVAASRRADRVLAWDPDTGILRAEAGLTLRRLNRLAWAHGWTMPVSPGTEFVTLGGMVAADVHGKNHHETGTLEPHLRALRMRLADGSIVECSREREPELFLATTGGMGLTGHILEVELQLAAVPSAWIECETARYSSISELAQGLVQAGKSWPLTAAWVDGLRRGFPGLLLVGRWASRDVAPDRPPPEKRGFEVPFPLPGVALSPMTIGLGNRFYAWSDGRHGRRVVSPQGFLYPLDGLHSWNRVYGRGGFTQYQCVLPPRTGSAAVVACLNRVRELGGHPFLVVLKDFGEEGDGILSFPRPGFTLAIDLPVDGGTQKLVDGLNEWLLGMGGRIYLAKDAFTRGRHFRAMEGERLERFQAARDRFDPERRLRSHLSVRLMGDPE